LDVVVDLVVDGALDVRATFVADVVRSADAAKGNRGGVGADTVGVLSFQRLDVYQRSIQFLAFVCELLEELPRGNSERADQLVRAAEAVPRNIAEGAGQWSKVDMSKHYKIARGEAMECAASLDVLKVRRLIEQPRYERGMALLEAVVAMLTKMIRVDSSTAER
jgi:four helix bundle protein